MLVAIGFLGTSLTLRLMTIIYLQIDFSTIVILRMVQVIFMPLIFIPISTLNYIGVPREKNNQVSGMSNFARNMGGAIGTSLLSTFLARQNQTHQRTFAAHTTNANGNFQQFISGLEGMFRSQGFDASTAAHKALMMAYQTVQAQANALSFKNSFWVMSMIVISWCRFRSSCGGHRDIRANSLSARRTNYGLQMECLSNTAAAPLPSWFR